MLAYEMLTEAEARVHPDSNKILRALGLAGVFQLDASCPLAIEPQDGILLCSDGLCLEVEDLTIAELIRRSFAGRTCVCSALLNEAIAAGASDNVCMQFLRFLPEGRPPWRRMREAFHWGRKSFQNT